MIFWSNETVWLSFCVSASPLLMSRRQPEMSLCIIFFIGWEPESRRWSWFPQSEGEPDASLCTLASLFLSPGLLALLVTSRRLVMDHRDQRGLKKNNIVCLFWQEQVVENDCQVTALPQLCIYSCLNDILLLSKSDCSLDNPWLFWISSQEISRRFY